MRVLFTSLRAVVPAIALALCACHGDSGTPPSMPAAPATLTVNPASVELTAGSGTSATATLTNTSTTITATNISATLPSGWTDVTEDSSACASLAPGAICNLTFIPGNATHPATTMAISGTDAAEASFSLQVSLPSTANIATSNSSIALVAGSGTSAAITVTNNSTLLTATNITADLTNTALAGNVTVDASDCASVAPGASCMLSLTPMNTAVAATAIPIQGSNTSTAGGTVTITLPTSAMITVTGSPLVLNGSYGTPVAGSLTVTNNSTLLTATGINVILTNTALSGVVTEDASQCATVAPLASCQLRFTPTGPTGAAATSVIVTGSNTAQAGASITVDVAQAITITLSYGSAPVSTLQLGAGGAAGVVTITNTSTTSPALNIGATVVGTAAAGDLTIATNTCGASLAASATCTLSFTPGSNALATTAIPIAGSNTNTVTSQIGIVAIGEAYEGGVIIALNAAGANGNVAGGLVVSSIDVGISSGSDVWGGIGTVTAATSSSDGSTNTATIITTLGTGAAYAALDCYNYLGNDNSATTGTWYLPAASEIQQLDNAASAAGITNLSSAYWTSTEFSAGFAYFVATSNTTASDYSKSNSLPVRCLRAM
jgi:hypothetical protein